MRYIYFNRDKHIAEHEGIVCVGYEFDKTTKAMNVAVTFCAPGDQFNKTKKVHESLPGRMAKGKFASFTEVAPDSTYENIANIVKQAINDAFPEGYDNIKKFVQDNNYKIYPEFAGVRLPFWLKKLD